MAEAVSKADSFTNLGNLIAQLLGRKSAPAISLEEELNGIFSANTEKLRYIQRRINDHCDSIVDFNLIHRSVEAARAYRFRGKSILKDIPVPGTFLAASAEKYASKILNYLSVMFGHPLYLTSLKIDMGDPVYKGASIRWHVTGYDRTPEGISINIGGADQNRVIAVPITIGLNKQPGTPETTEETPLITRVYQVTEDKSKKFHRSVGERPTKTVAHIHPPSFLSSALLDLSRDATGMPSGINKSMDFQFFKRPTLGDIRLDIFLKKTTIRKRVGLNTYTFSAFCYQGDKTLATGQISVISDKILDLERDLLLDELIEDAWEFKRLHNEAAILPSEYPGEPLVERVERTLAVQEAEALYSEF